MNATVPPGPPGQKLAVVIFNLGGPDKEADIAPFLFNFFRDRNVITLPNPLRWLLAWWISFSRSRGAAKSSYGLLGGKSPLLENTRAQARALEMALLKKGVPARVFIVMRHWHPGADDVVRDVIAYQPVKVVLLPLYPQFSTTTTLSAFQDWDRAVSEAEFNVPTKRVCCYPTQPGFIAASVALIQEELKKATSRTRLLFSAHGLPQKIVDKGDPYQKQCEATVAAIVQRLDMRGLDWQLCYQSRVGRLRWLGPSLEEALQKAADDGVGVLIYPLAFVSEHVETLVELDIECRHRATAMGIHPFLRAPTAGTHPRFIEGLRDLVLGDSPAGFCPKNPGTSCCGKKQGEK